MVSCGFVVQWSSNKKERQSTSFGSKKSSFIVLYILFFITEEIGPFCNLSLVTKKERPRTSFGSKKSSFIVLYIFTAHVRTYDGRLCFHRCVSVQLSGGGVPCPKSR